MSDVHDDFDPFGRPTDTSERPAGSDRPGVTEVDITDARIHASTLAGAAAPPADPDGSSVEAQRSDALAAWYTTATTPDGHLYGGDVEEGEMADAEQPDDEVALPADPVPDTTAWYRTASAPSGQPSLFERPATPEQAAYQAPGYDPPPPAYPQSQSDDPRYDAPRYDAPRYDTPQYDTPQYDAPQYDTPRYDTPGNDAPQPGFGQAPYEAPRYAAADPYPPVTNASDLYGPTSGNEPPRFERPPYEEPIPVGQVDDPFAPAGNDAQAVDPAAFVAAPGEAAVRPGAAPRRRPPSRRTRQRITFGVIFGLVVLLGAAAVMAINGRFDLPFGTGAKPPLPVCPSVAPTILPFSETSVHVLNASKINGFALKTTKDLQKLGFKVPTTPGNEPATTKVTGAALVRYGPEGLAAANTLKSAINGPVQLLQDGRPGTDVDLVLGATFKLKAGLKSPASPSAPAGKATCTPEPAAG